MTEQAFITNAEARTLKKRLEQLIQHAGQLKFLVGYFYFSGWQEIYQALKKREDVTVEILVGLDVDLALDRLIEVALPGNTCSNDELAERFFASLTFALNDEALDTASFYEQVEYFLYLIENERLHIRKTLKPNHAKLYFFKVRPETQGLLPNDGKFITGSSNLTRAGIEGQDEFNVEISDYGVKEAEAYFNNLWETAVPITEFPDRRNRLIQVVRRQTQVAPLTPFEAYALVLKTYLDLMEQKKIKPHVIRLLKERGYKDYQYQLDAVNQALTIIEQYNGAIIADVVGLGKSVIAGLIARQLGKRGLVICPPGLMGDRNATSGWKKYMHDFHLYDWEVRSSGDLENVTEYLQDQGDDIEVVIVDEAHRFRNEDTANYESLSTICRNRIVLLLTATPFNNSPADIFALLKLFIVPGKSKITLDENLEGRFSRYQQDFRRLAFISRYFQAGGLKQARAEKMYLDLFDDSLPIKINQVQARAKDLAAEIRAVLEPVLIRRNRLDLKKDPVYAQEVTELSTLQDPNELFYDLSEEQSEFYDQVINDYFGEEGRFKGAIYQPFTYEKRISSEFENLDETENRTYQQQRNLFDFMRRLVVKRFESSFGAFVRTICNFERVHEHVLEFIENSGGRFILDRSLIEKIYLLDEDEIDEALENFALQLAEKKKLPKHERIYEISLFARAEEFIKDIKSDLVLMREIRQQVESLELVARDPKAQALIDKVEMILNTQPKHGEPPAKVIIFSEYVDTVKHLKPFLEDRFTGKVLAVEGNFSSTLSSQILNNFDASVRSKQQENDIQILLTSDKLSEGVNLNRAGIIINYDIPWNPTRVIQRVGRINRIGKKVFDNLFIYNFFPTVTGSDIIKSREIAAQKMYLIHNTLGEDAKIFNVDETPSPAELFKRININPEEQDDESMLTMIRRLFFDIQVQHPDILDRIDQFPSRVKTAKSTDQNELLVFRRKGLGIFIQSVENTLEEKPEVNSPLFEEVLSKITCDDTTPRLPLSKQFWPAYDAIKLHREVVRSPRSEISLEVKAINNLQSSLRFYHDELDAFLPFIRTLISDLREYKTIPKFTLRRLASVELTPNNPKAAKEFKKELLFVRNYLGDDYLKIIRQRLGTIRSEIIIAIENQKIE